MTEVGVIHVTAVTHRGLVRGSNEDAIVVDRWVRSRSMPQPVMQSFPGDETILAAVADGMGGHAAGGTASLMVARRLAESGRNLDDATSVVKALVAVNTEIYDVMESDPSLLGMGSTVAGLVVTDGSVLIFNVGDSRVYLHRDGFLRQLTRDDVPADRTGRSGGITQAVGGAETRLSIEPHIADGQFLVDHRYLVCSDGLTDVVDLDTMEARLATSDDVMAVTALLEDVLARGAPDNLSILMVRIEDGGTRAAQVGRAESSDRASQSEQAAGEVDVDSEAESGQAVVDDLDRSSDRATRERQMRSEQ